MQNNFQKDKDKKAVLLNRNEENLIMLIRKKYRYGEIIVVCHDGLPQRIKKVDIFDSLHGSLNEDIVI